MWNSLEEYSTTDASEQVRDFLDLELGTYNRLVDINKDSIETLSKYNTVGELLKSLSSWLSYNDRFTE
ncbi:MAG: hypothetical protein WD512_00535 [Candidatus Paceibacterota bacterium]